MSQTFFSCTLISLIEESRNFVLLTLVILELSSVANVVTKATQGLKIFNNRISKNFILVAFYAPIFKT